MEDVTCQRAENRTRKMVATLKTDILAASLRGKVTAKEGIKMSSRSEHCPLLPFITRCNWAQACQVQRQ
jgi:hypothetical protein